MNKYLKILLKSIFAGIMIAIGGTINLTIGGVIGSILFAIGLFMIVVNGYNLYTGKIGYLFDNGKSYIIELGLTLIGNLIGTLSCGYILLLTRIGDKIKNVAVNICDIKLNDTWYSILVLSIFCGMLMYLAVNLYKELKDSGKYIAVFICVCVFILCGFEHCVANMYYFSVANMWSLNTILYLLIMILGNSIGSLIISIGNRIIKN